MAVISKILLGDKDITRVSNSPISQIKLNNSGVTYNFAKKTTVTQGNCTNAVKEPIHNIKIYGNTITKSIPNTYTELESILCDGHQYINIDYIYNDLDEIECVFQKIGSSNESMYLFGSSDVFRGFTDYYTYVSINTDKTIKLACGGKYKTSEPIINNDKKYNLKIKGIKNADGTCTAQLYVDDTYIEGCDCIGVLDSSNITFKLASRYYETNAFKGKLYKFSVKRNGAYIIYLLPCCSIHTDSVGMYDLINDKFYECTNGSITNHVEVEKSFVEFNVGEEVIPSVDNNYSASYKIPFVVKQNENTKENLINFDDFTDVNKWSTDLTPSGGSHTANLGGSNISFLLLNGDATGKGYTLTYKLKSSTMFPLYLYLCVLKDGKGTLYDWDALGSSDREDGYLTTNTEGSVKTSLTFKLKDGESCFLRVNSNTNKDTVVLEQSLKLFEYIKLVEVDIEEYSYKALGGKIATKIVESNPEVITKNNVYLNKTLGNNEVLDCADKSISKYITLNGSETWYVDTENSNFDRFYIPENLHIIDIKDTSAGWCSNNTFTFTENFTDKNQFRFTSSGGIQFTTRKNAYNGADGWKNYLRSGNIDILYDKVYDDKIISIDTKLKSGSNTVKVDTKIQPTKVETTYWEQI